MALMKLKAKHNRVNYFKSVNVISIEKHTFIKKIMFYKKQENFDIVNKLELILLKTIEQDKINNHYSEKIKVNNKISQKYFKPIRKRTNYTTNRRRKTGLHCD
jgi:hypothetical protein